MESEEARLKQENQDLQERLLEAEETLDAMRKGEIDAIVVKGPKGDQLYSLVSPEHPYQVFIDKMGEGAVILSTDGLILYANPHFFEMIGYPSETVIGNSLLNYIPQSYQPYFLESLQKEKKIKSEICLVGKNQQILTISLSVSKDVWKNSERLCLLLTDITSLKRAQRMVETSESITKILSEAPTLSVALQRMIEVLKTNLDWEVIVVWAWNKEKQMLSYKEISHIADIPIDEFTKKTMQIETGRGLMAGQAWSSLRPLWFEDITEDATFLRRKEAIQNHLRGAFVFPFYEEAQPSGIIELFRRTPFKEEVDDLLLNLATSIGIEVGQFIQRKIAEETLVQFSTIVTFSVNAIYNTDNKGIVNSWNPSAERIYGWKAEEMIGKSIMQIYPEDRLHEFNEIWKVLFSGNSIEQYQTQRLKKDGTLVWVNNTYGPIKDSFGKVIGGCVVVQDISFEKSAAETISHAEDKFKTYIEMTEDWIWEIDKTGDFTFSNPTVYKLLGYQIQEVLGKNLILFLFPEDIEAFENQMKANILQKKGWARQSIRFKHKNGSESWVESSASKLLNSSQELIGFRGICRDISESKNLEKVKNEFISIVNHELRTPITSILGALTLLTTKQAEPKEQQELITIAMRNSEKLAALMNDVMNAEKLQLGKLEYASKKMSVRDMVLEAIQSSEPMAKKFDVKIEKEGLFSDAMILGDKALLVQVMMDLLSNAIKFSPSRSTVQVSIQVKDGIVRISVQDHGQGIPQEFQPKIFQKFAQADTSANRPVEGIGLGLNISKSIIEKHGGTITYTTFPGKGTTFFIELPRCEEG